MGAAPPAAAKASHICPATASHSGPWPDRSEATPPRRCLTYPVHRLTPNHHRFDRQEGWWSEVFYALESCSRNCPAALLFEMRLEVRFEITI